jgi:tetratricopeptide (TPR) repeat protein
MNSIKGGLNQWVAWGVCATLAGGASVLVAPAAHGQESRAAHEDKSKDKDEKSKNNVSPKMAKPLKAAQELSNAKKYPEALAKLKEADAINPKTPYDEYVINELSAYAYIHTNDMANAEKAMEGTFGSQYVPQGEVATRAKQLAVVNYQLKNYDKAIDYGNKAIKAGDNDESIYTVVAQAYYLKNDYKNTRQFTEQYIDSEVKAGKTPKEDTLLLEQSSCVKLGDDECVTKTLEKLVTYHPKTEYWQNLVYSMFQAQNQNDRSLMNTYRLASEVDVLKKPEDYTEMAQLAIEQGSPGEAQKILEKGFQKNVFTDARSQDKNKRLLASAQKAADADKATLAKTGTEADAAATGDKDVGVGLAYLGYNQYDKAAEFLDKGLKKGSVKNEAEARLLLGIAQLKSGKKDDAMKSFKQVKGDANLERIANLWSLRAKQA